MGEVSALFKYIKERQEQKVSYITDDLTRHKKESIQSVNILLLTIQNSPALDVVALGFSNGEILLYNLKTNQIVQTYQLKDSRPTVLAFSQTDKPLLAVGNDKGDVVIFSLNDENVLGVMKNAHKSSITYLEFLREELTLITGSYSDNMLAMWQYDDIEEGKFRMIRRRCGLSAPLRKVQFYGDEGYHVIASSFGEEAEIKDYFLWNEGFEGNFSAKKNKKMIKLSLNTEITQEMPQITDFAFASNRAKDWTNLITAHKNYDKPYMWSTEDHTLVKMKVQWEQNANNSSQITKVFVTQCGNFGLLGYADGNIVKINMQSGKQQKDFHRKKITRKMLDIDLGDKELHGAPISGIFVDPYNTVLVSADTEYFLVNWDFYSGTVNKVIYTYPSRITMLKPSKTSSLFCVGYEDFKIEVYDMYSFNKGRVFTGHKNRIMDICFTKTNRQVVSCSLDCTIKVWDIISSQIVNNLELKTPVVSMDFDPSGEFLVTAFSNSKEIFIWNNKIGKDIMGDGNAIPTKFTSNIGHKKWYTTRKGYVTKNEQNKNELENLTEDEISKLDGFFKTQNELHEFEDNSGMIAFLESDIGKWLPLINFDEIREKNKPKQAVESNISAPFFLQFDTRFSQLANRMEGNMEEEKTESEVKGRVIRKENKNKFLDEIASNLEKLVNKLDVENESEEQYEKIFKEMKRLSPPQLDYEVRSLTFGKLENVEKFVGLFNSLFQKPDDYDLKQIFFNNFLNICADTLLQSSDLLEKVEDLKRNISLYWRNLKDQINSNVCMVQHFAKIKV